MTRSFQVTGLLQRQAWADRQLRSVAKVQDGLWSIPVPDPNNPLRTENENSQPGGASSVYSR